MAPNLTALRHDLNMIFDESLIIYFASGWRVIKANRSFWNVLGTVYICDVKV